ncbi:MAG: hypothetical protein Q8O13_03410 [Candidatus Omnitrophota bacterium]|nr:hypothetical protein [Candidatus Omnitrophota bacterium]
MKKILKNKIFLAAFLSFLSVNLFLGNCFAQEEKSKKENADSKAKDETAEKEKKAIEERLNIRYENYLYENEKEKSEKLRLGQEAAPAMTYQEWLSKQVPQEIQTKEYKRTEGKIRPEKKKIYKKKSGK